MRRSRAPFWFAGFVVLLGLFAPLIANDVPLVASVDGRWSFPAFAELVGIAEPGPRDLTWKQWWSRIQPGDADWALMPPWPYGPHATDIALFRAGPSLAHPLGNDDTGRDVLARVVHGAGTAVGIGLPAVLLAALLGTALGAWAGLGGWFADFVVLRIIELLLCFPLLLLLLFATAFLGNSTWSMVLVMGLSFWTSFARIVRGELLSLRERDFVHVARGLGIGGPRLLTHHLLPQVAGQVGVTAAFCMGSAIVAESTLSFLGLGPGPTAVSWGAMLRQGSALAAFGAWHLWLFPAAAVALVVLTCHVLADRLRPPTG